MPELTGRTRRLHALLQDAFAPTFLELRDESHLHAGHNPDAAKGGTHFRLTISSPVFTALGRVEQQRLVNNTLAAEFATGLHALSLKIIPENG